jgi:hypothetical protein
LPCLRQVPIAILLAILIGCVPARGGAARQVAALPLRVSENGRHLTDQRNTPFLVVGDTAWSIIAQLDGPAIDHYLDDRQTRGFNSIIVNLIEHKFCTIPPKTRSGLAPFDPPGDFSAPKSEYFAFAHEVVQKANERGIVVWLAPAYLGYGGGDEGFFREIQSGGKDRLRAYARFIGQRFTDLPNIIWLLGGDYSPPTPDRWTVTELALGIHEVDTNHLMTVHDSPENSAVAIFGNEPWLTVDTVYSYQKTLFAPLLAEYARVPPRPFVLIEATYEGEHDSTPEQIRRQAYWAMLCGGCGQFFGNNPVWHFDGPGLFATKLTWQEALDATGSRDIIRLSKLFSQLPWHQLRPAQNDLVVTDDHAEETDRVLTARTADGKLALSYFPSTGTKARDFSLVAEWFAGPISARWYNPVDGDFGKVQGTPLANRGRHRLKTPGDNGAKANDWVLVMESR